MIFFLFTFLFTVFFFFIFFVYASHPHPSGLLLPFFKLEKTVIWSCQQKGTIDWLENNLCEHKQDL